MKLFATLALLIALPIAAQAAPIAIGSTLRGDAGGINAAGAAVSIATNNVAYTQQITDPASEWVWIAGMNPVTFEFGFDLTGFDVTTTVLSGLWGVDNVGTVALNGTEIASLPAVVAGNYARLHAYGANAASLFNQGANVLTFNLANTGGPAAFRATAIVTADAMSAVPLPAAAPLLIGGVALLGGLRSRRRG